MLTVIGIVLFALVIMLSIALHEVGHLVPAKRFGVKVTEYMIGFGPMVWSRRRGETDYGVKAIPLGGYIRMIGMLPPPKDAPPGTARAATTGRMALLVEEARRQSLEEVAPGDENRVFYKLPVRKRIVIMLGGPLMNLLLAFVLFAGVLVGIGLPEPTLQVTAVTACTPTSANPSADATEAGGCPAGSQPSPASAAGIQPGDTIVSIDGREFTSWDEMTAWVRAAGAVPVTIVLDRGGSQVTTETTLATAERPVTDETGRPTGETESVSYLGVRPEIAYVSQPWSAVPQQMWDLTTASVKALVSLPVRLYELLTDTLIGGGERQIDGPVSVVGVSRLGGEIAALDEPIEAKAATFLGLAASLNLFLFLFNLLPVLPLDGGHVAGALWEGTRRRLAKWRGKPDPGPVDLARLMPVAYGVAAVLIGMSLIVIWADLVKPITLG
ncbi:MAG: site-2 protease family protein [Candidatus Nanopelagicales bacterium]